MDKRQLLQAIKDELKRKGLTAAEASERAVGNTSLITNMGRERYGMPSTENLQSLCDVLGWEFYVGPPRESGAIVTTEIQGEDYVAVRRYSARLSAGDGVQNCGELEASGIAFRRDWMERQGLSLARSMVVSVHGDSMAPTLSDGDLVLIDERKTVPIGRRIYALLGPEGDALVKRLEYLPEALLLHSDNEAHATRIIHAAEAERVRILGEVVWWGHAVQR